MAIEAMKIMNIRFSRNNLIDILIRIDELKDFYPILSEKIANDVKNVHQMKISHQYQDIMAHIHNIIHNLDYQVETSLIPDHHMNTSEVNAYLDKLDIRIEEIHKIRQNIIDDKKENEEVIEFLNKFVSKDINVEALMDCQYVTVRFGYLDNSRMDNLQYYLEKPFIFDTVLKGAKVTWCYYAVTNGMRGEIDNLFKALDFHEVSIPHIVHGTNTDALRELNEEVQAMDDYIFHMDQKLNILKEEEKQTLTKYYITSSFLNHLEEMKKYVTDYQSVLSISGYIKEDRYKDIEKHFLGMEDVQFSLLPTEIVEDFNEVPVLTNNPFYISCFESISKPSYADKRDLTIYYMILYLSVFLWGFGDIALGFMLLMYGLISKKLLFKELGIFSLIGGLLYGTCGYFYSLYYLLSVPVLYRLIGGFILLVLGHFILKAGRKGSI